MIKYNTNTFLNVLEDIVKTYNETRHRGLSYKTPLEIHLLTDWRKIQNHSLKLFKKHAQNVKASVINVLPVDTVVRISTASSTFNKRTIHVRQTYELFKIKRINKHHRPITYLITDLEGKEIKGTFYKDELVRVSDTGLYNIKILKTRKNGEELFVSYINYPDSRPQWIKKSQITKLA